MHQLSTVPGLSGGARTLLAAHRATLLDAGKPGSALFDTLEAVPPALDALQSAKAKAATAIVDPRFTAQARVDNARGIFSPALTAATSAAQRYNEQLDTSQAALKTVLLPPLPKNTDSALLAFRAGETVALLERSASAAGGALTVAERLLTDALSQGDATKAYIVAGGVLLTDTYQRLGVDMSALGKTFARVIAQAQGNDAASTPGGKLLALLSQGGDGSLRAFGVWLRQTLFGEQKAYDNNVGVYLATVGADGSATYGVARA